MHQIIFRFTGYRSPRLPLMIESARAGAYTPPAPSAPPCAYHETLFDLHDQAAVSAARILSDILTAHPCAHAVIEGRQITIPAAAMVLRCYEKSFLVSDARAYCWKLHTLREDRGKTISYPVNIALFSCSPEPSPPAPPPPQPRTWFFPCRLAVGRAADIALSHPTTLRAQVEAVLADSEAHWCPRLQNLDQWDLDQWGHTQTTTKRNGAPRAGMAATHRGDLEAS
jgi:hypothetical protein